MYCCVSVDEGMSGSPALTDPVLELPSLAAQYIEVLTPTGSTLSHATGFFVRDADGLAYLATNRHVVTGRDQFTGKELSDIGGTPSALRVSVLMEGREAQWTQAVVRLGDPEGRPMWREHPQHGAAVDVIAVPLLVDEANDGVDINSLPLAPGIAQLELTTAVYVVGFPVGFDPLRAPGAIGVWTRGTIAWHPRLDWNQLPSFLLDARTRKGQSGSPVIFYADKFTAFFGSNGDVRTGPAWSFVGIYSGRIDENSDLGIVWKRQALQQIIEAGERPTDPWVPPLEVDPDDLTPH